VSRGYFDFVKNQPAYAESEKDWYVELLNSTYVWYDAILDPVEGFDVAGDMRKYLRGMKEGLKSTIEKHFVYFLASRIRVRFCTEKRPRYQLLSGKLEFYIEIGRERSRKKCTADIWRLESDKLVQPKVEITDRYITIHNGVGGKISMSIYELLDRCDIETGINTEIQYVGYTETPEDRPFNRKHRGFADMLHWTTREDEAYDYFAFYNLFKVTSVATRPEAMLNFVMANSMTDEVPVGVEERILEKALIKYFGTKPQELNKKKELTELNNQLEGLIEKHRINSITFDIEMNRPCELFRFFSRSVEPTNRHHFTCQIGKSGAEIVPPKDFGLMPIPSGLVVH
jgi:hypothetical protein